MQDEDVNMHVNTTCYNALRTRNYEATVKHLQFIILTATTSTIFKKNKHSSLKSNGIDTEARSIDNIVVVFLLKNIS
jgi:hypothetical protein